jgi:hypothetical protein
MAGGNPRSLFTSFYHSVRDAVTGENRDEKKGALCIKYGTSPVSLNREAPRFLVQGMGKREREDCSKDADECVCGVLGKADLVLDSTIP